ncbi:ATP-dependent Clp protease adapter protein ClpS [Aliarcobacter thereius]|uniref:ATP-dependent Clp protease adapter protein ClpS n=2 Tax=Aliarcobacter thereius TaxID=544718 RepID=A0A1C0B8X7_9BACT|nr:ATP-dependent Clp protease adaptor ClpS [Aliarcobacter thereius]OCL88838.1 ATP-dependent Clp protease adapter protein ClpS [Aliarcobacter thereius]OCL92331.1 ATP-dependent Clp protease adapter protein ClpS [Aliarcobacter thereius]OCL94574.1 ATP-dependent Clp protease adapter protein ClpS [Aliarcobacter thereius LMG 24486]OCM00013.1 ATP-dependent Clp protease adapter protein ClpS [Aliarcobacter thereius]QBF15548.1 ClpAP chaperone-protease complex specificity factor [Aliarcobacter thereius LM
MSNEIEIELNEDLEVEEPKKYSVFLLNDDYSTMDFVIDVLTKVFRKNISEAEAIMLNVHNNGKGLCGIYSFEIASTKVAQVKTLAREQGFPLKAIMEEE